MKCIKKYLFIPVGFSINKEERITSLDGTRGLAIILVLLHNIFVINFTWIGVNLFFVLSGFLITGILLDGKGRKNCIYHFLTRRILRIFPLYYFFLLLFFVLIPMFQNQEFLKSFRFYYNNEIYFWTYLQNWFLALNFDEWIKGDVILVHLWSLAVEEQFYLFWPLVIFALPRNKFKQILIIMIFFSLAVRILFIFLGFNWTFNYMLTIARLDDFSIGALAALVVRNEIDQKKTLIQNISIVHWILLVLLIVLFSIESTSNHGGILISSFGYTLVALYFASLILCLLCDNETNILRKLFEYRILTYFGKRSYSIYLFHYPIKIILANFLASYFLSVNNDKLVHYTVAILCIILSLIVSEFTWHLIEKPFLNLRKYFTSYRNTDAQIIINKY